LMVTGGVAPVVFSSAAYFTSFRVGIFLILYYVANHTHRIAGDHSLLSGVWRVRSQKTA
jgi:hypothetical protein